jgi:hypothetical protein
MRPRNEAMQRPASELPAVIIGLEAIAAVFGRCRQTVARWIRTEGFPAARLPSGEWFTTLNLIDQWVLARNERDAFVLDECEQGQPDEA